MKTEAEINQEYKNAFAAAVEEAGGNPFEVPPEVRERLAESHRQEWIAWIAERDASTNRSESTNEAYDRLDVVLARVPGLEVNLDILAGMGQCRKDTARRYMAEHPARFAPTGAEGTYVVVAGAPEVAATAPTLPQDAPNAPAAVAEAAEAMARLTGHPSAATDDARG